MATQAKGDRVYTVEYKIQSTSRRWSRQEFTTEEEAMAYARKMAADGWHPVHVTLKKKKAK